LLFLRFKTTSIAASDNALVCNIYSLDEQLFPSSDVSGGVERACSCDADVTRYNRIGGHVTVVTAINNPITT